LGCCALRKAGYQRIQHLRSQERLSRELSFPTGDPILDALVNAKLIT
jgi:hypothetical protein